VTAHPDPPWSGPLQSPRDDRRLRMLEILEAARQQYGHEVHKVRWSSPEEEARYRLLMFQSKLIFAGLHLTDNGQLHQVKPPLPGFESVAEAARRAGAIQHCFQCRREKSRCRCENDV
jgi:hypothetical protein